MARKIDRFTEAYIACALWSSSDINGNGDKTFMSANYGADDIADEALQSMIDDCRDFQEANAELLASLDSEQCGHDFWLTRNGHGAGFWDRGLGELGRKLTDASKPYGSIDLYVGDDGLIHSL